MTSQGKTIEDGLSGEGGLLLTSLKVDRVSLEVGGMTKEKGGAVSTGSGLTLNLKSGKKLLVASLLCRLKTGRGCLRSGGS